MTLNIYGRDEKGKKKIVKTYNAESADLSFGIVEDIMEILETVQNNSNENEIMALVLKNIKNIKPLFLNVFEGLTEEELRNASTNEVIQVAMQIIAFSMQQISTLLSANSKNALRATV